MIELRNIEFYTTPDGGVMIKQMGQPVRELLPNDYDFIDALLALISERYPETIEAMEKLYQRSKPNRRFFKFRMVDRFCRCNFARYDQTKLDIDEFGNLNIEEVDCPLHGTGDCPFFGIICKPKELIKLSAREIEVCKYVAQGYSNNDIGLALAISPFTVIRHRRNIRKKLGAVNTAQMVDLIKEIL